MIAFILFAVVSAVVAITDPTHLCDEIASLDCKATYIKGERDETVCGVNGVTYDNFCYYSQARCNDKTITVASVGRCGGATAAPVTTMMPTAAPVTTSGVVVSTDSMATTPPVVVMTTTAAPVTQPGTTTKDPILAAFCQNKDSIQCGTDLSPICGSDKQFYLNKCEYSKAFCDNNSLTSKDISFCTSRR